MMKTIIGQHKAARGKGLLATLLVSLCAFAFTGCGDFLEEYSQDHDYVRSWTDLNELLIGDGYMPVNRCYQFESFSNKGMFLHLLSDEVEENNFGSNISSDSHPYEYGYLTWAQRTGTKEDYSGYYSENQAWTSIYKRINVCNNVLNSVTGVPQKLDEDKSGANYVAGQAHFLRAFYYFWLVNLYGHPYDPSTASTDLGVPLKTSQEVEDKFFSRNTVQECYDLIVSDLQAAEQELGATTTTRKSIYHADSVSVHLLESRVYLYMQNWEKAAEYAQKVINEHPAIDDLNSDNNAFMRRGNPETIFSMGGDDLPAMMSEHCQFLRVSNSLYNTYKANDLRKTKWFSKYGLFQGIIKQPATETFYSQYAPDPSYENYYQYNYTNSNAQYNISSLFWLRSGEAYLNYAEAEAYMGNEAEARDAINKIRKARFNSAAADPSITSTGSQLISDIRNERRMELALEGHRWFDLRRYRVCAVQPSKISLTHNYSVYRDRSSDEITETRQFVLTEDDPSWTMPIPNEVIEFNVGMPNNGNPYRNYTILSSSN